MSIEKQLNEAFKHNESSLQCPPSLDSRIIAEYDKAVMARRRSVTMFKKRPLPKVVMIALVFVLLCGFAYGSKLLMSDSTSKLSYEIYSNKAFHFSDETIEMARSKLSEVKSRLELGETAVVYLPELSKDYPLFAVENPTYVDDLQQWQSIIAEQGVIENVPRTIFNGLYHFKGGTEGNPFYASINISQKELIEEMKAESKNNTNNEPVWRIVNDAKIPDVSLYSQVYQAENGETIHLSWQIYSDWTFKVESYLSSEEQYEEVNVEGKKAHYIKNNQALLAKDGLLQILTWMVEKNGDSIIYSLESDSPGITKERLVEIFKSMN